MEIIGRMEAIQKSLYQEKIPYCVVYLIEEEKKIYHIAGLEKAPTPEMLNELWDGLPGSTDWEEIQKVLPKLKVDVVKTQDLTQAYNEYNL